MILVKRNSDKNLLDMDSLWKLADFISQTLTKVLKDRIMIIISEMGPKFGNLFYIFHIFNIYACIENLKVLFNFFTRLELLNTMLCLFYEHRINTFALWVTWLTCWVVCLFIFRDHWAVTQGYFKLFCSERTSSSEQTQNL